MPLPSILDGFKTRQKQFFHIFETREKIQEKSVIFLRFFHTRFFHPKIFSNTTEIRYFVQKLAEIGDFFVLGCTMVDLFIGFRIDDSNYIPVLIE